jgi:hypothetical protein
MDRLEKESYFQMQSSGKDQGFFCFLYYVCWLSILIWRTNI